MFAAEITSHLQRRGITLKVVNGSLKVRGAEKLSDREKTALRTHRSAILKVLAAGLGNPTTTANQAPLVGATAVVEPSRECGNCTNFEKYPYEPLGSCHARKRMQHTTSKPRQFGCSDFRPVTDAGVQP